MSGHLYAVLFSSGTVKVGRSDRPGERLKALRLGAKVHGVGVQQEWVSPPAWDVQASERRLIDFCAERWEPLGNEYFPGADYGSVVAYAEQAAKWRKPEPRAAPVGPTVCLVEAGFVIEDSPGVLRWRTQADGLPAGWTEHGMRTAPDRPWLVGTPWRHHPRSCEKSHPPDAPHWGPVWASIDHWGLFWDRFVLHGWT